MPRVRSNRTPRRLGPEAERRVRRHFALRGYRILATNAWIAGYELDLVVRRGRRIVVCEVKAKGGDRYGDPLEMITHEKLRRLLRAAEVWLARRPDCTGLEVRFEAIGISRRRLRRVPLVP